jgi:hypothetical protein
LKCPSFLQLAAAAGAVSVTPEKLSGLSDPAVLEDMLWGYFVLSGLKDMSSLPRQKQAVKLTACVDDWF